MQPPFAKNGFRKIFVATIVINGLIGLGDLIAGIILLSLGALGAFLTLYGPHLGSFQTMVIKSYEHLVFLSPRQHIVAIIYFLSHGSIKLFLVWALLTKRLWAYPLALFFFGAFSLYEIGILVQHFSWFDVAVLLLNVIVFVMVAVEYRRLRTSSYSGALKENSVV